MKTLNKVEILEATIEGTLVACSECGSEMTVYGQARLRHHDDGTHTLYYGHAEPR